MLRSASIDHHAHIEVKLLISCIPNSWEDRDVFFYFKRFANVLEARILKDKGSHRNVAQAACLKCLNFHEAEAILRIHRGGSIKSKDFKECEI